MSSIQIQTELHQRNQHRKEAKNEKERWFSNGEKKFIQNEKRNGKKARERIRNF